MTSIDIINPESGQLSILYSKWMKDPETYGSQMTETVDKIIHSTLRRQSLHPVYRRVEDNDDLIQELRLLCFSKLGRIKDPSNKRIFNFLRVSIKLALKDRARKVGKRLDREEKEAEILGEHSKVSPSLFYFGDELLEQVATLLSDGETKQTICLTLEISRSKLQRQIDKLKVIYSEKE